VLVEFAFSIPQRHASNDREHWHPGISKVYSQNVWLKNRLYLIRNIEDLKSELLHVWLQVPLVYVQLLYPSLPRRCRQVLIQKGSKNVDIILSAHDVGSLACDL
jgi:hypothetical protein